MVVFVILLPSSAKAQEKPAAGAGLCPSRQSRTRCVNLAATDISNERRQKEIEGIVKHLAAFQPMQIAVEISITNQDDRVLAW
jgi:hypothetical protein